MPHESSQAVQTLAEVAAGQMDIGQSGAVGVEMTNIHPQPVATLAEVNPEGQLILTDASGLGKYSVFCPGFQKGRVPSEKGTLAR